MKWPLSVSQNSEFSQLQGHKSSFSVCPPFSSVDSTVCLYVKALFLKVAVNLYVVTGMFSWSWRLNGRESMDENQWHLLKYFRDTKVFHNIYLSIFIYIYIYLYISIYLYIYLYLSIYLSIDLSLYIYIPTYLSIHIYGHKWFTTHRVLKSHRSKMNVITTMALWQLMHLGTWCTVIHCWYQWTKKCSRS